MPDQVQRLNHRARMVYRELMAGKSEKEIADCLTLSIHTVHAIVRRIYKVVGVSSQRQLAAVVISRLSLRIDELEGTADKNRAGDQAVKAAASEDRAAGVDQSKPVDTI